MAPRGDADADMLVHGRARRSTAGNRMKALLEQELERDELFEEVEDDIDFEAQEEQDVFDSDFDRDSSDGQGGGESDDEEAGERRLEEAERAERKAKRAKAVPVHVRRPAIRPPPPKPARRESDRRREDQQAADHDDGGDGEASSRRGSKRRRIAFAPSHADPSSTANTSETGSPGPRSLRTSSRSATVQNKLEVEEKLREAQERKAALPVRHAPKRRPQLTQDALIAEALETEEKNRESLKKFLQQEEARRAKDRVRKERIQGPFVRWVSVGLRPLLVSSSTSTQADETNDDDSKDDQGRQPKDNDQAERTDAARSQTQSKDEQGDEERMDVDEHRQDEPERATETAIINPVHDDQRPRTSQEATAASNQAEQAAVSERAIDKQPSEEPGTPPLPATLQPTEAVPPAPSTPAPATPMPTQPSLATAIDLTEDPAVAARAEALRLKAQQDARQASSSGPVQLTGSAQPTSISDKAAAAATVGDDSAAQKWGPLQARTVLSVERTPEDWTWEDDFRVLLGDHCSWSSVPIVPARNRPLRPRQSICPITGLPALYRDPRTGIPYANAKAYKIITDVLKSRFIWTGRSEEEIDAQMGDKERRAHDDDGERGGRDDDGEEDDGDARTRGAGKGGASVVGASMPAVESEPRAERRTNDPSPSAPSTTTTPATKPRYEMVWTPAVAPGDEEAIMAAAAQLPAGSTRSGRRGARKT
ncbi:uncharacterized protein PFL1_02030 [Pseudozyma flocculosa PF-1]|uniref:uncharacterized protein n=1 Tax=Pseudozyma flocculosa PF-1 TaxID=1277687 RepID=UPI0004560895|nr:uncharacterized protein PFL1_02030 [Pseudozyma flocculosa PF-1]EPQ30504.1 hypothetical protein PFL1_02030 [Pseudozyma flocculosa PF-1]